MVRKLPINIFLTIMRPTFWSNQCSNDEEYDQSSLKVSRINSDSDFVLIGSHTGVLRIYKPAGPAFGENAFYRPNDLYLETQLGEAILQIDVGKLVSGSQSKQIAVLYPRSIGIYTLLSKDGIAEHGTQNILNLVYEHKLERSAANFIIGPFGGVQNRDFICIQSVDGVLTFFEQETFSFSCCLPNFLLPFPIVYVKSFDILVTLSSDWILKSYKYRSLSDFANQEKPNRDVESLWEYNIGEGVLDIQTLYDDVSRQSHVAVLGEKNLYCFNDYRLRFMRKLEFLPHCFLFYFLDDGKCMFLVVAETNTLLLYEGTTLKWSAKLDFLPISIGRAFFNEINGALVMLSEHGYLQFAYLGTEPNIFSAPPLKNLDIDFDKVENELLTLNNIIKSNHVNSISLPNDRDELDISMSISPQIENFVNTRAIEQPCCKVSIEIVPQAIFEEVHLSVTVQKPLIVVPSSELYTNLTTTTSLICFIYSGASYAIPSLEIEAVASYITSLGVSRICSKTATVPLHLVYESCPPLKDGQHRITLNLSENSVPLLELFPEFMGENSLSAASNAIGFKHFMINSPVVTILVAKSYRRYRLQSDDIICLNLLVQEVTRRLKSNVNNANFTISYTSQLPITDFLIYVKAHFEMNQKVTNLQNELNVLSSQYRQIQKRLVAKFKQKNPTALGNLDLLLQTTYEDIIHVITNLKEEKNQLLDAQMKLACILNLIQSLLNLLGTNDKNIEAILAINATFLSKVYDYENQNWEDVIDAALCFLLRTSLAKNEKDKLRAPHTSFDEVKDIPKLEKHFTQVLERIAKGCTVEVEDEKEETETVNEECQKEIEEINNLGTEFAAASTRAISARQSLLRRRRKVDG